MHEIENVEAKSDYPQKARLLKVFCTSLSQRNEPEASRVSLTRFEHNMGTHLTQVASQSWVVASMVSDLRGQKRSRPAALVSRSRAALSVMPSGTLTRLKSGT